METLLHEEAERPNHGDAAVSQLGLAAEHELALGEIFGEPERVEEADRASHARHRLHHGVGTAECGSRHALMRARVQEPGGRANALGGVQCLIGCAVPWRLTS